MPKHKCWSLSSIQKIKLTSSFLQFFAFRKPSRRSSFVRKSISNFSFHDLFHVIELEVHSKKRRQKALPKHLLLLAIKKYGCPSISIRPSFFQTPNREIEKLVCASFYIHLGTWSMFTSRLRFGQGSWRAKMGNSQHRMGAFLYEI